MRRGLGSFTAREHRDREKDRSILTDPSTQPNLAASRIDAMGPSFAGGAEGTARPAARDTAKGAKGAASALLSWIFPSRCAACEEPAFPLRAGICDPCLEEACLATPHEPVCPRCALPLDPGALGALCEECATAPPAFATARALGPYAGRLRKIVQIYKFKGYDILARPLGERLAGLAKNGSAAARVAPGVPPFAPAAPTEGVIVVPAPSTRERNTERGYDPAVLLAQETARRLSLPMVRALARASGGPAQETLDSWARRANPSLRFVATSDFRKRSGSPRPAVLLVDDVLTTGATLRAAARALLDAGAVRVDVLVLARTPAPRSRAPQDGVTE